MTGNVQKNIWEHYLGTEVIHFGDLGCPGMYSGVLEVDFHVDSQNPKVGYGGEMFETFRIFENREKSKMFKFEQNARHEALPIVYPSSCRAAATAQRRHHLHPNKIARHPPTHLSRHPQPRGVAQVAESLAIAPTPVTSLGRGARTTTRTRTTPRASITCGARGVA